MVDSDPTFDNLPVLVSYSQKFSKISIISVNIFKMLAKHWSWQIFENNSLKAKKILLPLSIAPSRFSKWLNIRKWQQ